MRRETGVHEKGRRHSGPQPRAAALEPSARAAHPFEPRTFEPVLDAANRREPPPAGALEPPPHETTTAGHRAYSSTLDATPAARRSGLRLSPDVLGAVALLLGSLVAVYSIYRHSQRDNKRPESQQLAIQAEARGVPPAPAGSPSHPLGRPLPPGASVASTPSGRDAGAPIEERARGPAFFDGHAEAAPDAPPALRADELPPVDPALRSLQDAIVVAAKAHRFALERRRARKAEPRPRANPAAPAAPRPIDEADPYTEGSAP